MSDEPPTPRELARRGQQYRNYDPEEFLRAGANDLIGEIGPDEHETQQHLREALKTIESARFKPFLDKATEMFDRLDRDEQLLFARRNPDLLEWMAVYMRLEYDGQTYGQVEGIADQLLTDDDRLLRDTAAVPEFERRDIPERRTLLEDLQQRRRSYRNFTPYELRDLIEQVGKRPAREVFQRIESGRFSAMLDKGRRFFGPLDPDERELFARRNPGIMMWISEWNYSQDLIHGEEMFRRRESDIYPTLEEVSAVPPPPDGDDAITSTEELKRGLEPHAADGVNFTKHATEATFDWKLPPAEDAPFASSLTYDPEDNIITGAALRFPPDVLEHSSDRRVKTKLEAVLDESDAPGGTLWTTYIRGDAQVTGPHIMAPGGFSEIDPTAFVNWVPRVLEQYRRVGLD